MTVRSIRFPMLHASLCLVVLTMCLAAAQCTANISDRKTVGNSVRSKDGSSAGAAGGLPPGNSGVSNILGLLSYLACRQNDDCREKLSGTGLNSHPVGNSANTQTSQISHAKADAPAQTTPVTTTATTNGELNNANVGDDGRNGTPGSSATHPTLHGDGGHVDNAPRSVLPAHAAPPPLPKNPLPDSDDKDSDNEDSAKTVNDADGHDAATGDAALGDHQSNNGQDSGGLLPLRSVDGSGIIPATITTTTKTVKPDANKEALTMGAADGSSGSQSLLPTLQKPTNNGTPAAKLTRAHTTAPAKSGEDQPSVKVTTTNTSTNRATQPAQKPAAANPGEKDTTHLQTLQFTTSTAPPTDSKQASATSTTDFAKGESTVLPTSLPKLSKALQSLDMKESSSSSSAFFALAALSTFVMMAMALAC